MTIAVAQFGVVATAPAHTHESGDGHGIREIVLSHAHEEPAHHHDDGDHHDDHERAAPDVVGGDGSDPAQGDAGHGEHAHVHACPQFTPLSAQAGITEPVMLREIAWPSRQWPAVSHLSSPPLRPPRTFL